MKCLKNMPDYYSNKNNLQSNSPDDLMFNWYLIKYVM